MGCGTSRHITVRAHKDGLRFCQIRDQKVVWFKRYGLDGDVDRKDGGWSKSRLSAELRGNELIVVRNYTPRSSYYGLPDHIPALAAMAGWRAQAEFNVRFFDNNAVPTYVVVVEGADITPELERRSWSTSARSRATLTGRIVLPVPAAPATRRARSRSGSRSSRPRSKTPRSGCTSRTTRWRSASPTASRRTASAGQSSGASEARPPRR